MYQRRIFASPKIKTNAELSQKYDQTKSLDVDEIRRKFYCNSQKLNYGAIRGDKYYSEIEGAYIMMICNKNTGSAAKDTNKVNEQKAQKSASKRSDQDQRNKVACFLNNIKSFQELLQEKRAIMECCEYPDLVLQELQLVFERLKGSSKTVLIKSDKTAQKEFNKAIITYCDMKWQFRDQIHKKESKSNMSMLETDQKPQSERLLDNIIDTLLDQPKLNSKNPENIRTLLQNIILCLKSITKMGLDIEAAKIFIARITIRKFDMEALQHYECKIKKQKQIQNLEDMFDFLRQMMLQTQEDFKEGNNSTNHEKSKDTNQQKKKPQGKEAKETMEKEENVISNDFGKDAIESVKNQQPLMPSQELLVFNKASAEGPLFAEKNECIRLTLITKPNELSLHFPPGVNTITRDESFRSRTSPHAISKQKSAEILEMHIRNLNAGISLKARYVGTIILNLHTPGLSEADIRTHYESSDTPESLKEFITPLLEKTGMLLHKIIIFPEDEQNNCNQASGHNKE